MLIEQNINIDSSCEHHFLPIVGQAHIGYIPKKKSLVFLKSTDLSIIMLIDRKFRKDYVFKF